MKRTLITIILVITFILPSCGGNPEYYDTCKDAFYAVYGDTFDRDSEIDKVSELCATYFDQDLIIYAVYTPNVLPYKFVSCRMIEKNGKARVVDSSMIPPQNSITYDGWYIATSDNGQHFLYQWINTSALPEERDSRYQYRDFSFEDINGDTVGITLVYYEIKSNY